MIHFEVLHMENVVDPLTETYLLAAIEDSILFPKRKVGTPIIPRYLRVVNIFRCVQ